MVVHWLVSCVHGCGTQLFQRRQLGTSTLKNQPRYFDRNEEAPSVRQQVRRRQAWIVLFAIVLASIAGFASAQSPDPSPGCDDCPTIEYYATEAEHVSSVDPHPAAELVPPLSGGVLPTRRLRGNDRPAYVELVASLSNFDSDADPDGWRAEIVLRDRNDRPVVMRANASFELTPRVATADHRRFVNATGKPIRWSMPLEFDADGVARVKLPLRDSLKPMLGWNSAIYPPSGTRVRNSRPNVRYSHSRHARRSFVTSDLRNLIGTPSTGEMRVRVSVPTEGVFEAAAPVFIRPSVLVDTQWPYR